MPAHWSIEDGQSVGTAVLMGDDAAHLSAISFVTNPQGSHLCDLVLHCADGTLYTQSFNRNGTPQGAPVKTSPPPPPDATGASASAPSTSTASLSSHESSPKSKK